MIGKETILVWAKEENILCSQIFFKFEIRPILCPDYIASIQNKFHVGSARGFTPRSGYMHAQICSRHKQFTPRHAKIRNKHQHHMLLSYWICIYQLHDFIDKFNHFGAFTVVVGCAARDNEEGLLGRGWSIFVEAEEFVEEVEEKEDLSLTLWHLLRHHANTQFLLPFSITHAEAFKLTKSLRSYPIWERSFHGI